MNIFKSFCVLIFAAIILLPLRCGAQVPATVEGSTMTVTLEEGDYAIIGNADLRKALSETLLIPGAVFVEEVPNNLPNVPILDPWLFPNNITTEDKKGNSLSEPAMSWYIANLFILGNLDLCNGNIPENEWAVADEVFQKSAGKITGETAKLKSPIPYIFFDGVDKGTGEYRALPARGYYNAFITSLLGEKALNLADADGRLDSNIFYDEQIKKKALVIVAHPESKEDFAENHKFQHVLLFPGNLPLPKNITDVATAVVAVIENIVKQEPKAEEKKEAFVQEIKKEEKKSQKNNKNMPQPEKAELAQK